MIVWGGYQDTGEPVNTGGRYNPATDTWTTVSLVNAPSGRFSHSAVWTGIEMIVWGGFINGDDLDSGARYNPTSDTWTTITQTGAPPKRSAHAAVWTGSEMIVWGGFRSLIGPTDTGASYNPVTDTWTTTTVTSAPGPRASHAAVWTGSEMIVWGGANGPSINTGGRYNPTTQTWTATSTSNAPVGRNNFSAVWTGREMIVWGGFSNQLGALNDGGRYNPTTNTWIAICDKDAPPVRSLFSGIWTGKEMIVWGGVGNFNNQLGSGGKYLLPESIFLLSETSNPNQAAALDSLLFLRDPFPVINASNFFNQASDRNTRVILFAFNLGLLPAEPPSSVVVNLVDSNNQTFDIPAQDVRFMSNFVQVTFRLPDNVAVGTCVVKIKAHNKVSNVGTIRIKT
jgi:N-acetylneuraminic acid mutarotase